MATYSPFNRIREESFTNVSGSGTVITTITKRSLISAKATAGSSANLFQVYFESGTKRNSILWRNEDYMDDSINFINGASIVDAGTQIRIQTSGNNYSFTITIIEID